MKWFLIVLIILFNIGCMVEPTDVWPNHHIPYDTTGLSIEEMVLVQTCMILWETAGQRRFKLLMFK